MTVGSCSGQRAEESSRIDNRPLYLNRTPYDRFMITK